MNYLEIELIPTSKKFWPPLKVDSSQTSILLNALSPLYGTKMEHEVKKCKNHRPVNRFVQFGYMRIILPQKCWFFFSQNK